MNTFLHLVNMGVAYHRGYTTGLAGLIGLFLTFFITYQWDEIFYPLLKFIGIVALFDNLGLIHPEAAHMTAAQIILFLFAFTCVFSVVGFASIIAFIFVSTFLASDHVLSKAVKSIGMVLLFIAFAPFLFILFMIIDSYKFATSAEFRANKKKAKEDYKKRKSILKEHSKPYYLTDTEVPISFEEAREKLYRVPLAFEHQYLLAYPAKNTKNKEEVFVLVPQFVERFKGPLFLYKGYLVKMKNRRKFEYEFERSYTGDLVSDEFYSHDLLAITEPSDSATKALFKEIEEIIRKDVKNQVIDFLQEREDAFKRAANELSDESIKVANRYKAPKADVAYNVYQHEVNQENRYYV